MTIESLDHDVQKLGSCLIIQLLFFHSGGGLFTLMVSMIGLLATSRRSPILLRFYAFMLVLAFIVLLGGVACSLRVIFTIHVGVNHSLAVPLIRNYGKDAAATSAWDLLVSVITFFKFYKKR